MIGYGTLTQSKDKLRLAEAMHFMGSIDELTPVMVWLEESLASLDAQNRFESDPMMIARRQGAAQTVYNFLRMAEDARSVAEDIRKNHVSP